MLLLYVINTRLVELCWLQILLDRLSLLLIRSEHNVESSS